MTWRKRTIMEMAREAGISSAVGKYIALDSDLERFAELVREDEREACAKLCEQGLAIATSLSALDDMEIWGEKFAAAIRARGDKHD